MFFLLLKLDRLLLQFRLLVMMLVQIPLNIWLLLAAEGAVDVVILLVVEEEQEVLELVLLWLLVYQIIISQLVLVELEEY